MSDQDDYCATETPHLDCEVSSNDDELPPAALDTIHFNLDTQEGKRRLRECLDAPNVKEALCEFDRWLRNQVKHTDREDVETLQEVRDRLWVELGSHGVNLDDG